MSAIKKKLRSQRGASITFALLLFLVCAIISSVIIVASTASAGRMSQLATMDQRYYAVNSTAELLCHAFTVDDEGKPFEVTVNYTKTDAGITATADPSKMNDPDPIVIDASEAIVRAIESNPSAAETKTFEMSLQVKGVEGVAANCTIVETAQPNGLLQLEISNALTDADTTGYKLVVTLASRVKKTVVDAQTGAARMTVGWKLHSIQKGRADAAPTASPSPGSGEGT